MIVKCGPRRSSVSRILYLIALDLPESFFNGIMRIEILCERDTIKLPLHLKKGSAVGCKYFIRKLDIFNFAYLSVVLSKNLFKKKRKKKETPRDNDSPSIIHLFSRALRTDLYT